MLKAKYEIRLKLCLFYCLEIYIMASICEKFLLKFSEVMLTYITKKQNKGNHTQFKFFKAGQNA